MTKQYTVEPAYTGNDKVTKYVDGKKISYEVMSYWETEGYCDALESEGYTKAYDLDKLRENVEKAKDELRWAKQAYDEAVPFALIKR